MKIPLFEIISIISNPEMIIPHNRSIMFISTSKKSKKIIQDKKIRLNVNIQINLKWKQKNLYSKINNIITESKKLIIYNKTNKYILKQLNKLSKNYNITGLDINSCNFSDNIIERLTNIIIMCPNLTYINLCNNLLKYNVLEILLKGLKTLKLLEHINLSHNFLTIENTDENNKPELLAQVFKNYPLLKYLNLNNIKFGQNEYTVLINEISKCPNLECIELQSSLPESKIIRKSLFDILPKFKKLKKINLCGNKISCDEVTLLTNVLSKCILLEELNLKTNNIRLEGIKKISEVLSKCISLKNLNLRYNSIGLEGANILIESIANCPTLRLLDLCDNNINKKLTSNLFNKIKEVCPYLIKYLI